MNQADVSKLISKLRINIAPRHRNLRNPDGPEGRLRKLRQTVTGLVKHERIELNWNRADEARGYAERLISEAIRYGDTHKTTMDLADFWLLEKQLVHKLFKVLVPRFRDCNTSYTRLLHAPKLELSLYPRAVLELRGNPYPPLFVDPASNRQWIQNVLLDEARREYRSKKYAEISETLSERNGSNVAETKTVEMSSSGVETNVTDSDVPKQEIANDAEQPSKT